MADPLLANVRSNLQFDQLLAAALDRHERFKKKFF